MAPHHHGLRWLAVGLALLVAPSAGAAAGASAGDGHGHRYLLQGVEAGDTLNVRAAADPRSPVLGTIAPEARDIRGTGRTRKRGPTLWREIVHENVRGWVNSRFLTEASGRPDSSAATETAAQAASTTDPPARDEGGLEADLVCYLNRPLWRLALKRNGEASCTETCDAPTGLRASPARATRSGSALDLRAGDGALFASVEVRRTDRCTDEISQQRTPYEVVVRTRQKGAFRGCCKPMGPPSAGPTVDHRF